MKTPIRLPMSQASYRCNGGDRCPFCGSESFTIEPPDAYCSEEISRDVVCNECERSWREIYKLSGYEYEEDNELKIPK